jgi:hypothetical protein
MSDNLLPTIPTSNTGLTFFDPKTLSETQRVAKMFAASDLVPDIYKVSAGKSEAKAIANCMIAMDIAHRIGASLLMVMQNLYTVHGNPAWKSKFLIGIINTCGRFNPLRYKFTNKGKIGNVAPKFNGADIDNIECVAYTSPKNNSSEILEGAPVSVELAIIEGWYTKPGSKWPSMTQQMLMYRAASFWCNAYAPELSLGLKTEDEIIDIEGMPPAVIMPEAPDTSKANSQILNAPTLKPVQTDKNPPPIDEAEAAEIHKRELDEAQAAGQDVKAPF